VSAVNRFITAAVSDLSHEQKAALKAAGEKRKTDSSGGGPGKADRSQHNAAEAAEAFLQETMQELGSTGPAQHQQQAQGSKGSSKKKRRS
jgi:hypothetical protein